MSAILNMYVTTVSSYLFASTLGFLIQGLHDFPAPPFLSWLFSRASPDCRVLVYSFLKGYSSRGDALRIPMIHTAWGRREHSSARPVTQTKEK